MESKCVAAAARIMMSKRILSFKGIILLCDVFMKNHTVLWSPCSHPIASLILFFLLSDFTFICLTIHGPLNIIIITIRGTQTFTHWDF